MNPASATVRITAPPLPSWAPLVSAGLLGVAGALQIGASAIRWQPCFRSNGNFLPPIFDSRLCLLAQDHSRDYLWMTAPFVPIVGALTLAGIASLLLAGFWILWASFRRDDLLTVIGAGVTGGSLIAAGGTQLIAGATGSGSAMAEAGVVPILVSHLLALGPIVASLRLAVLSGHAPNDDSWRFCGLVATWLVLAVAAVVSHPLVDFFLLIGYSGSHDTPVGSGAPGAFMLIVTALVFTGVTTSEASATKGRSLLPQPPG